MSGWTVELSKSAQREFRHLDEGPKRDAAELPEDLREQGPLVPALELTANPDNWRVRFHHDRYRIIYQISRSRKHILVTRIRPRPTAYEGIKR